MDPAVVYQEHLDATSDAMWRDDRAALGRLLICPHSVTVDGQTRIFETEEQVWEGSRGFRSNMTQLGATAYHRLAVQGSIRMAGPDRMEGRHDIHVLRGGTYVTPPYQSAMTLVLDGDAWRASDITVFVRPEGRNIIRPLAHVPAET